jgi:hypothetical protein
MARLPPLRPIAPLAAAMMSACALALGASSMAAVDSAVECGLFRDYLAPDPIALTAGSITFGLSGTPEAIAPDATLVPPTDTALPSLQGGVPTCLTVMRDAGLITSLAFAPSGTVSGTVILIPDLFGPGQDAYVIADRVFTPVPAVTADPDLAALIKTAADNGANLSITFQIDLTSGVPTGFTATTTLSGAVVPLPNGDIQVGDATLPNPVIDGASRASLESAAGFGVPATVLVTGIGTLEQGGAGGVAIDISLLVTFTAPAAPAPTPTAKPSPTPPAQALPNTASERPAGGDQPLGVLALATVVGAVLTLGALRVHRA